ncbi:hypothetical protein GCM10028818_26910 [Spirosoma horti]
MELVGLFYTSFSEATYLYTTIQNIQYETDTFTCAFVFLLLAKIGFHICAATITYYYLKAR